MPHSGQRFAHVETNRCPNCRQPRQVSDLECRGCGIVFAKYRGPVLAARAVPNPAGRLSSRELEVLLSTLSAAIGAGMTPAAFADSQAVQQLSPRAAARLRSELAGGIPLSEVLARLAPDDAAGLALFRARERQGDLAGSLKALSDRLEQQRKDRQRTAAALAYPGLLLLLACLLLPLPLIVRGVGVYLSRALPPAIAVVALALGAFVIGPRLSPRSAPRRWARQLGLALPISGAAVRHRGVGTFLELLASCLRAGLTAREALELSASASAHPLLQHSGKALVRSIEQGATLAAALADTGAFQPSDLAQIEAAERSGTLDRVLPVVAAERHRRARFLVMAGIAAAGGIVLAAVIGLIAWRLIAGWSEIFQSQGSDIDKLMEP